MNMCCILFAGKKHTLTVCLANADNSCEAVTVQLIYLDYSLKRLSNCCSLHYITTDFPVDQLSKIS